ncbi:MAG: GGDEF domain-containing protein [Burkholderiales bacterium]|nr:GGDEF domain-containing protein [Burkholderiales bacterium]
MLAVDVYTCYAVSGAGSLLGLGLMHLLCSDQPRVREALRLYKLGFILLAGLIAPVFMPAGLRSATAQIAISLACLGVGVLGWAFHLLNGRQASPLAGACGLGVLALLLGWATDQGDPHVYAVTFTLCFAALSAIILIDQMWIILRSPRVQPSEAALLAIIALFLADWLAIAHHTLSSPQPVPSDWIHAPAWLRGWSALSYAVLPLGVAAVVFALINERLMQALRNRALSDDLTGALSRRGLREMGEQMLALQASSPNGVAVLMIDADHFKAVNDRHGHLCGDEVLRHIARLMREHLRAEALVARYCGEEFTVLLPLQAEDEAVVVAERLRAVIEATPCQTAQGPIPMTVSIGVAYHEARSTLERTLQRADERLYIAKQTGRNRVVTGGA